MHRICVKLAYYDGSLREVPALSRLFNVSWVAMRVRLEQLGLEPRLSHQRRSAA